MNIWGCTAMEQQAMPIQLAKATMDSQFELSLQRIGVDMLVTSAPPSIPRGSMSKGHIFLAALPVESKKNVLKGLVSLSSHGDHNSAHLLHFVIIRNCRWKLQDLFIKTHCQTDLER